LAYSHAPVSDPAGGETAPTYAETRIARFPRDADDFPTRLAGAPSMEAKVAAVTLALAVPAFLWPPKPARAAAAELAITVAAPAPVASAGR
jgi:hypothetical protein